MSGALAFDPLALIPAEPTLSPTEVKPPAAPREWLHGLELLGDRRAPRLADAVRWNQIIRDCWAIVDQSVLIVAAGWSIENLFGFDPDGMSYDYGLAVALRGRRLSAINPDYATIPTAGGTLWHYPRLSVDAPMLWNFDERKL